MEYDHIALGVPNLNTAIDTFVNVLGHKLIRTGVQFKTGRRIAMLADATRQSKVELIEAGNGQTELLHVAFQVSNVDDEYDRLRAQSFTGINPPHPLHAAKAHTALLTGLDGLKVQIIQYDPDSPDLLKIIEP